jgi:hypothetical protein
MLPQAMTQQQRALPAKHGRFVRNAYDRFGVLQRGASPTSRQASVCISAVKDGGKSYGRNLWVSPWHESAAYLPP